MSLQSESAQPSLTGLSVEVIEKTLREVMEREGIPEEAQPLSLIERLLELLPNFGGAASSLLRITAALGLALVITSLIMILRRLPAWRARKRTSLSAAAGERGHAEQQRRRRAAELRAQARECEASGDLTAALRLAFMALLVDLDESGEIEFRRSWTDRELLARGLQGHSSAAGARARLETLLSPLIDELEPLVYGGQPVTPRDLRQLEEVAGELGVGG